MLLDKELTKGLVKDFISVLVWRIRSWVKN